MASVTAVHRRGACPPAIALVAAAALLVPSPGPGPQEPGPCDLLRFAGGHRRLGLQATTFSYDPERHSKYILYTNGTGVGLLDYDGDGRADLFVANGMDLEGQPGLGAPAQMLWRQGPDGGFAPAGRRAGIAEVLYGQGVAVGDLDADGWPDICLTAFGPNRLYRNLGDGSFEEVAARWGVDDPGWGTSAAFTDLDRDGLLDLYVVRYLRWSPELHVPNVVSGLRVFGSPFQYAGLGDLVFLQADGRFEDRSDAWGVARFARRGLGVAVVRADGDEWPDVAVANDGDPNDFWVNREGTALSNEALLRGLALGEDGRAERGMGISWGDYDGDGWPDLVVANFEGEPYALYRSIEGRVWMLRSWPAGIGAATRAPLGFGAQFIDVDSDGWLDIFFANGHVFDNVAEFRPRGAFAQPDQLFHNHGGRYHDASGALAAAVDAPLVGRASAAGDIDGDGDVDLVVTNINGPVVLYENRSPQGRGVWVRLVGTASNREGLDARLRVVAGTRVLVRWCTVSGSFLASNGLAVHFGLGDFGGPATLEVDWPSGGRERVPLPEGTAMVWVREGRGVVAVRRWR